MTRNFIYSLLFIGIVGSQFSCTQPSGDECLQCAVKDKTGKTLLLDSEKCGDEQFIVSYKAQLTSSNQIHCGVIKVQDSYYGGQTVYSEQICDLQLAVDAAKASASANHGCGTCNTYFYEDSVVNPVLDCTTK